MALAAGDSGGTVDYTAALLAELVRRMRQRGFDPATYLQARSTTPRRQRPRPPAPPPGPVPYTGPPIDLIHNIGDLSNYGALMSQIKVPAAPTIAPTPPRRQTPPAPRIRAVQMPPRTALLAAILAHHLGRAEVRPRPRLRARQI